MKKSFYLAAAAALLMATTSAHAGSGFSFEIGGQRIHVDAPRNCNSLDCLSVSNNGSPINLKNMNLKGKKSDDDNVATNSPPPAPPAPAPAAINPPPAPPAPPAPVANNPPPAPPAPVANYAPPADSSHERISGLSATSVEPSRVATTAPAAPATNYAPPAPPAPQAAPVTPPPAEQAATTPLGLWQTADNKGNVRIEQCGANLCGFGENGKDQILINMKPGSDNKWSGRIHDPESGSNYDSTIALKGPNVLKVQGCAFGGMFCGAQTWKRVS